MFRNTCPSGIVAVKAVRQRSPSITGSYSPMTTPPPPVLGKERWRSGHDA